MRTVLVWAGLLLMGSEPCRGLRQPALSPDGRWIAFSWHGDLWRCPSGGGKAERLTTDPADEQKPAWSPDGRFLAYSSDKRGTRDLYVLDLEQRESRQLTWHSSDDDAPAWSPDGAWIAFQSNRDSNLDLPLNNQVWDVWKMPAGGGTAVRVTRFRGENPAWSPDGKFIAYDRYSSGYGDGEHDLFVIAADGSGQLLAVASGAEDSRRPQWKDGSLYFSHEANGLQKADATRNVWRAGISGGALIQLTGHRGDQVTWPSTCAGSDQLVYEYDFDLWSVRLSEKPLRPRKLDITAESYPESTSIRELTSEFGSPVWSPSGREFVCLARGDLWVVRADGTGARPLTVGEAEDRDPSWSADGRDVVYVSSLPGLPGHVWSVSREGAAPRRLSRSEEKYRRPRLSPDGKRLVVTRERQGDTDLVFMDVRTGETSDAACTVGVREDWGCFLSPERLVYAATRVDTELMILTTGSLPAELLKSERGPKESLSLSPDGLLLAYSDRQQLKVLSLSDGGIRTIERKGVASTSWSPDSQLLLVESRTGGSHLEVVELKGPGRLALEVRASRAVPRREEMLSLFSQAWGAYYGAYYDPFFHGVEMIPLREKYRPLAEACQTRAELHDLINDMLAELRSSHILLRPAPAVCSSATASLGLDWERLPDGRLRIARLEPGGPAALAGLKAGELLVEINGTDLGPDADADRLLAFPSASGIGETQLLVRAGGGDVRTVHLRGLDRTALRELKYANRVAWRKERVRELSGGRLAYHSIRRMAAAEVELLKNAMEKEFPEAAGLVLDERDGVGGLAHRPFCALLDSSSVERLNANPACWTRDRNGTTQPDKYERGFRRPERSWNKPVILIQNEISRSDKEIFPYTFRHLGIGYLVGMPTAGGVIGGSDRPLPDGSKITVSNQGWFTTDGRNMEGWGVPPDFRVPETHEDLYAGRDASLEKAVEVLLAQMDGRIAGPRKFFEDRKAEPHSGK